MACAYFATSARSATLRAASPAWGDQVEGPASFAELRPSRSADFSTRPAEPATECERGRSRPLSLIRYSTVVPMDHPSDRWGNTILRAR